MTVHEQRISVTAGLLGVDVSDIVAAGGGGTAMLERRVTEIERRILALEAASGMEARQGGNEVPCEARQPGGEAETPKV